MSAKLWLFGVTLGMAATLSMAAEPAAPAAGVPPAAATDAAKAPAPAAPKAEKPLPPIMSNPETPEVRAQMDALAAKIALPDDFRIVMFGDSITMVIGNDGRRIAQNFKYPEMINEHLQAKFGKNVQVINAGWGGDTVGYALKRYKRDVIEKKPNLVFINLGINDSKLTPDQQFTTNFHPLEKFVEGYKQMITDMKAGGAQVVVLGTIACYDKLVVPVGLEGQTPGPTKPKNWFGKPEEVKKYNAAAQALGKELGCDYVDLYDIFMAYPDMSKLFDKWDGVHTRDRGQELIALQVMKYLAQKYPAH